jgi:hypothetical protein
MTNTLAYYDTTIFTAVKVLAITNKYYIFVVTNLIFNKPNLEAFRCDQIHNLLVDQIYKCSHSGGFVEHIRLP